MLMGSHGLSALGVAVVKLLMWMSAARWELGCVRGRNLEGGGGLAGFNGADVPGLILVAGIGLASSS